ncbi:MAG: peroxiredoxin [Pseudomonadota bacterium]
MSISVGDKLPDGKFLVIGDEGPGSVTVAEATADKKVVLFGLPGAYTSTCTSAHMPSFIRTAEALHSKGVDDIICFSVNDPFVMQSWAKETGADLAGIKTFADADGSFTKAIGLDFSAEVVGFFGRAKRHAMVVEDGTVRVLNIDENPGECNLSAGEAVLDML